MEVAGHAIQFSPSEVAAYYHVRVPHLKKSGGELRGPCPVHNGRRDSFAVNCENGTWFCHSECGRGGDILDLERLLGDCDFGHAKESVFSIVGRQGDHHQKRRIVAEYNYTDEHGVLLYQVCRFEPKGFAQRRPNGHGGWTWKLGNVRRVLYHLAEVIESPIVFLPEGEKDCEALRDWGFPATCNAGGARAPWLPGYTETLRGREVIIIPDNDGPGWQRAVDVSRHLVGHVARLRVLDLPEGIKDISDWFAAGKRECELILRLEGVHAV